MADIEAFGLQARWHHLTSLVLHLANTLLLFAVLRSATGATGKSFLVASLFGIHPLHVESVAWVAERKDVLSTFLWMLAVGAYVRFVHRPGAGRYVIVLLLFSLGLTAKPMVLTFPLVLLLLDYWPLGRWRSSAPPTPAFSSWRRSAGTTAVALIMEKVPLFALAVASAVVTLVAQSGGGMTRSFFAYPLHIRAANALLAYVEYLGKTLWPLHLAIPYPHPGSEFGSWNLAGAAFVIVSVSSLAVRFNRSHPYLAVGWLWYLLVLAPVIGIVQVADQAMADRYTYVPLIGIFIAVLWCLRGSGLWRSRIRPISIVAAAAVLVSLGFLTRLQVRYWQDDITLHFHAIDVDPGNYFAHGNLASALASAGRLAEAVTHYQRAFQIKPLYHLESYYLFGLALMRLGRDQEAVDQFTRYVKLSPRNFEAHLNLGVLLARQGRTEEALGHYTTALQIRPDSAEALNDVGAALADLGRLTEAIPYYREALRLSPGFQNARINLEMAMFKLKESGNASAVPSVPVRR